MNQLLRRTITHPMLAIGSTILWGVVEFIALQRSRRASAAAARSKTLAALRPE